MGIIYKFFLNHGFIFELLIAAFLFVFTLKRRKFFVVRTIAFVCIMFTISILWNAFVPTTLVLQIVKYTLLFFLAVIGVFACFNVNFWGSVFIGIGVYATQHCAFQIGTLIKTLLTPNLEALSNLLYLITLVVVYVAAYFVFASRLKRNENAYIENRQLTLLCSALILFTTIFQNLFVDFGKDLGLGIFIIVSSYDIMCCIFTLCIQYGMFRTGKLQQDYNIMEHILYQQKVQMQSSKENIDLINIKCHDLKHQIAQLGDRLSKDEQKDLEKAISFYDASLKTGNEALDVILAEKSLVCEKNKIKLDCIADGNRLSGLKQSDIYSLFGNAIDNAIEAVQAIADTDKRLISMRVKESMGMLAIHISNNYEGTITLKNGFPATTKADKNYHGFGMKSIAMIVNKYKGNLTFNEKNGIVYLNILLPI